MSFPSSSCNSSGCLILLFELMDCSMFDFIKNRNRRLSEARVKNYLYQLVCGLHYLHRNGLFHRDIKPENILIRVNSKLRSNPLKVRSNESISKNISKNSRFHFPGGSRKTGRPWLSKYRQEITTFRLHCNPMVPSTGVLTHVWLLRTENGHLGTGLLLL